MIETILIIILILAGILLGVIICIAALAALTDIEGGE